MVPKKANDFKKSVAEELGLSEDLVSNFIDFFWDRVRTHMSELNHETLQIPNLGTFKVKHWKIDETVESHKATIIRVEGKFAGYRMKIDLTDRIEKLERIKNLVEQRELKFKEIRNARKNKDNMEQQSPDMGGADKQDL
ncbi:MAG TPA: HU family DNA-binding protein [Candidatus Dojkabacteria bacterium]|nr:HU family DNA-binding protein [Candidatus Dojkabacteria bacterium]